MKARAKISWLTLLSQVCASSAGTRLLPSSLLGPPESLFSKLLKSESGARILLTPVRYGSDSLPP